MPDLIDIPGEAREIAAGLVDTALFFGSSEEGMRLKIARALTDLAARVRAEREPVHLLAKTLGNKLMSFTPGGSEYFTKVGDDYYADAEACGRIIREKLDALHEARKDRVRLERELASVRAEREDWRPISEAPKDGTRILACEPRVIRYRSGDWVDDGGGWVVHPTKFQFLPPPPKETPPATGEDEDDGSGNDGAS